MRKAFFLGAGFSFEMGMPLVSDVTNTLTDWLTRDKLQEINARAAVGGGALDQTVINAVAAKFAAGGLNYEELIGWMEERSLDPEEPNRIHYQTLQAWMTDRVENVLYLRHVNNLHYLKAGCRYYRGLVQLLNDHCPTWVFSLNHDVCLEIIASELGVPLRSGFSDEEILRLPAKDNQRQPDGDVSFKRMSRQRLASGPHHFFEDGEHGINLLKLHGALDLLAYTDNLDPLQLIPDGDGTEGWLTALRKTYDGLYVDVFGKKFGLTKEIACYDQSGEMQLLRRTLLSGDHKFGGGVGHQYAYQEALDIFVAQLDRVDHLVLIGYSLCDRHINGPIEEWLAADKGRCLEIVDPFPKALTARLQELKTQDFRIEQVALGATDYLDHASGNRLSEREALEKRMRKAVGRSDAAQEAVSAAKFQRIAEELSRESIHAMVSRVMEIGVENIEAMTHEEAAALGEEMARSGPFSVESVLKRFLEPDEGTNL